MMYARAAVASAPESENVPTVSPKVNVPISALATMQPKSTVEQYWAARALTAEALLSARVIHQNELSAMASAAEDKRLAEIAALQRSYDGRHRKLEKLVAVLLACLVAFVSAVLYIASQNVHRASSTRLMLPSHFTIPILSPFTSVVEHETSIINTRLVAICLVMLSVLAYACFRYWLTQASRR